MRHTSTEQIILRVASEGGCIELMGRLKGETWQFRVGTQENLLRVLEKDESLPGATAPCWLNTWEEALKALDAYFWQELQPLVVHPDFHKQVYQALSRPYGIDHEPCYKAWDLLFCAANH